MSLAAATALAAAGDLSPSTSTLSPALSPTPGAVFRVNEDTHFVENDRDEAKIRLFHPSSAEAIPTTTATVVSITTTTDTVTASTSTGQEKGVGSGDDDDDGGGGDSDEVRVIAEEAARLLRSSQLPVQMATHGAGPSPGPRPAPSPVPVRSPSPMSVSYPGTVFAVAPSSSKATNKTSADTASRRGTTGGDSSSRSGTAKGHTGDTRGSSRDIAGIAVSAEAIASTAVEVLAMGDDSGGGQEDETVFVDLDGDDKDPVKFI